MNGGFFRLRDVDGCNFHVEWDLACFLTLCWISNPEVVRIVLGGEVAWSAGTMLGFVFLSVFSEERVVTLRTFVQRM